MAGPRPQPLYGLCQDMGSGVSVVLPVLLVVKVKHLIYLLQINKQ